MAGDDWQKFANLRALYGYMYAQPGKKLLFMGGEFAQRHEWDHDAGLDWSLLDAPAHAGVQRWVRDLNQFYRNEPALHELTASPPALSGSIATTLRAVSSACCARANRLPAWCSPCATSRPCPGMVIASAYRGAVFGARR